MSVPIHVLADRSFLFLTFAVSAAEAVQPDASGFCFLLRYDARASVRYLRRVRRENEACGGIW